ncbi:MAG: B12-binding domain-containing radical SAM protein, partial [Planctomycetota bacterium]
MRILLVQPDCDASGIGFRLAALTEPLALEMLAAAVPDHEVRIFDMRLDANFVGVLAEYAPDVVGVTALTTEVYAAREILLSVKQFSTDIFTLVGGHHVSLIPSDFRLPQVDAIAIGEGEVVFPSLIEALDNGKSLRGVPNLIWRDRNGEFVENPVSDERPEMDRLPLPRRDLTSKYRNEYYFLFDKPDSTLSASRGCPYRCKFCSVWNFFHGKTRQMSARRVVDEIKAIDTDHITFVDDNFLTNYRREDAIAEIIRSEGINKRYSMQCRTDSIVRHPELLEKWVDIGLYAVLLGLEGSDDTLKNVNKKNSASINDEAIRILHDNGLIIWGCFIADPDWTEDDFKSLRDYVTEKEITHTQFTVLTPLPGTVLWSELYDELLTHDYTCYDILHAVVPTRLSREEFYRQFANLYRQSDLGPYYDLVREGKLTVEDCKRGKQMLDAMAQWQLYLPN